LLDAKSKKTLMQTYKESKNRCKKRRAKLEADAKTNFTTDLKSKNRHDENKVETDIRAVAADAETKETTKLI
jgi:hypothetical protein